MSKNQITAPQSKIGRASIGWTEQELAVAADVPVAIVIALEAGTPIPALSSSQILAAFDAAGISFFQAPDGSPRMRARTLDGIIEAPVTLASRTGAPP